VFSGEDWARCRARPREKFVVRYDPRDLSKVYLRDHDGHYWSIPYSDRRLPPVTLAEVKAASKRLSASGEKYITLAEIFASIEEQRALIRALLDFGLSA
jgi:putative transposase